MKEMKAYTYLNPGKKKTGHRIRTADAAQMQKNTCVPFAHFVFTLIFFSYPTISYAETSWVPAFLTLMLVVFGGYFLSFIIFISLCIFIYKKKIRTNRQLLAVLILFELCLLIPIICKIILILSGFGYEERIASDILDCLKYSPATVIMLYMIYRIILKHFDFRLTETSPTKKSEKGAGLFWRG